MDNDKVPVYKIYVPAYITQQTWVTHYTIRNAFVPVILTGVGLLCSGKWGRGHLGETRPLFRFAPHKSKTWMKVYWLPIKGPLQLTLCCLRTVRLFCRTLKTDCRWVYIYLWNRICKDSGLQISTLKIKVMAFRGTDPVRAKKMCIRDRYKVCETTPLSDTVPTPPPLLTVSLATIAVQPPYRCNQNCGST